VVGTKAHKSARRTQLHPVLRRWVGDRTDRCRCCLCYCHPMERRKDCYLLLAVVTSGSGWLWLLLVIEPDFCLLCGYSRRCRIAKK